MIPNHITTEKLIICIRLETEEIRTHNVSNKDIVWDVFIGYPGSADDSRVSKNV